MMFVQSWILAAGAASIVLAVGAYLTATAWFSHRERMAKIAQGIDPDLTSPQSSRRGVVPMLAILTAGIAFVGLGVAVSPRLFDRPGANPASPNGAEPTADPLADTGASRSGETVLSAENAAAETVLNLGGKVNGWTKAYWRPGEPVTHVYLHKKSVTDANLMHLKSFKSLRLLNLSNNSKVTDAGLEHLTGLTNLQHLDLRNNTQVTNAGMRHLEGLISLEALNLSGTQVTDAGLVHLKPLSNLWALNLNGNHVTGAGFVHLLGLNHLKRLSLTLTEVTDARLELLGELPRLSRLYVDDTQVTDAGLKSLSGLTNLQELNVCLTQVTDAGVHELQAALPECKIRK